jgi:hypothetical protein
LPPLDPAQPIIFAVGAMSSIYPALTKGVAMFISPLTGEVGESYAVGRLYDRAAILSAFTTVGGELTEESATARRIYATKLRVKKALGQVMIAQNTD